MLIKKYLGKTSNLHISGSNFDDSLNKSFEFVKNNDKTFIHPFDDHSVINGQSTIAVEILEEVKPDIILGCVGGGGLISGLSLTI